MAVAGSLLVTSCPINNLASTALCSFSLFVDLDDKFSSPVQSKLASVDQIQEQKDPSLVSSSWNYNISYIDC
jgi:hypothetical protein